MPLARPRVNPNPNEIDGLEKLRRGADCCPNLSPMNFRNGFFAGLLFALILAVYLVRLWQPEHQVELHSVHLLSQIEKRNWNTVGDFVASDYQDRWGNDRALSLERLRMVFRAPPDSRIESGPPSIRLGDGRSYWTAKIIITGSGEFAGLIEARVNSLEAPFELEWRRGATWPWDWKLVSVRNPAFEIHDL